MDYSKFNYRIIDIGLNLRNVSDTVGEGYWTRLSNIRSAQEAKIQTREGRERIQNPLPSSIHSMRRVGDTLITGIGGDLYRDTTLLGTGFSGNPLSIVPYRQILTPDVWGFIGDTLQMKMVKGDGTFYKWGIDAPPTASGFAASADAGLLDSTTGLGYDWRYTYYSSVTGAESNGSPVATEIAIVLKKGNVPVVASLDIQVDSIRVYRRGGTLREYHLTQTVPNVDALVIDNSSDNDIALNESLDEENFVPFTSQDSSGNPLYGVPLPYLWGPFLGQTIFGCGDPNRKGAVYFTNDSSPHSAGEFNFVEVTGPQEPLMNGFIYGVAPFVFSRDNLYGLRYGSSTSLVYTSYPTPVGKGVLAPHAFAVGDFVYFLGQGGIYATDCQSPAISITEETLRPIFNGITVDDYVPVDLDFPTDVRMAVHGQLLHFYYRGTNGILQHLIYNIPYKRWKSETFAPLDIFGYGDESLEDRLYLQAGGDGAVYASSPSRSTDQILGVDVPFTCEIETGFSDMGNPQVLKEYGNLLLDADPGGNVITITPILNGGTTTLPSQTITGSGRQKFALDLGDTYGYSLGFNFTWTGDVSLYQLTVLLREDEEPVSHWEFPETTHNLSGLQQVKDIYLALRSTSIITATITTIGPTGTKTTNTYNVPSTGGEKQKLLVPLAATKGFMTRYELDSSTPFRLYGGECEVRVKPWKTNEGFQLITPFA